MNRWMAALALAGALAVAVGKASVSMAQAPAAAPATTQPPIDESTRLLIDSLVDEITGGDADQQSDARGQLIQLGPVARLRVEQLQREARDGRTRRILGRLLEEIDAAAPPVGEMARATVQYPLQPQPISLQLDNATLEAALGRLSELTGVPVRTGRRADRRMPRWPTLVANVRIDQATFRGAADAIGDAFGGVVAVENGALQYSQGSRQLAPDEASGPVAIRLYSLNRNQVLTFADPESAQDTFNVNLQVQIDPRMRIAGSVGYGLQRAEDNRGNVLLAKDSPMQQFFFTGGGPVLSITMNYPKANPGDRVRVLEGNLALEAITEAQVLTVADILQASNLSAEVGKLRYRIVDFKPRGDDRKSFQLRLVVQNNGLSQEQWNKLHGSFYQQMEKILRVTDADGQALESRGGGGGGGGDGKLEFTLYLGMDDSKSLRMPLSLRMEVPSKTQALTVPFSYGDLPMP